MIALLIYAESGDDYVEKVIAPFLSEFEAEEYFYKHYQEGCIEGFGFTNFEYMKEK